ncbi:MAG: leucyl aminopeptidase family protein [Spirosomataceae bacterium]
MQINLRTVPSAEAPLQLVALLKNDSTARHLEQIAQETGLSAELMQAEWKADTKEIAYFFRSTGQKVMLLGLGKKPSSAEVIRAFRALAHQQKAKLPAQVQIDLRFVPTDMVEYAVNGMLLGGYNLQLYKTESSKRSVFFEENGQLDLVVEPTALTVAQQKVTTGQAVAAVQLRVFDLMNAPANKMNPLLLADWAVASGEAHGYSVQVFDKEQLRVLGFHALLAVNQGSEHEPRFLVMEYKGPNATKKVGLVGKGVTFDTGGISIKQSTNMHLMKSDMGGGAAVLGTVELAARLQLPVHVIGAVPVTENCVDGLSMKPGDVIGSYLGKTIEVTDTDAEGRLILADGLAYVAKHYQPDVLIDLATLTGNVIMALGYHAAGLFTNNDDVAAQLLHAADETGERLWRLPIWEVYQEDLASDIADVRNYAGKPHNGAIAAAKFLEVFTDKHPAWAHLDIAGTAFGDTDFAPQRAATAYGVRLLVEYLRGV